MLLTLVNELREKIKDSDISQYSDEELLALYKKCNDGLSYYEGMGRTVKDCANSVYGANGSPYYRFFNIEVAADIPYEAKELVHLVDKIINGYFSTWELDKEFESMLREKFGSHITIRNLKRDICVYGDTDSRYIDYGEIINTVGHKVTGANDVIDFVLFVHKERLSKIMRVEVDKYVVERNGEPGHLLMELEQIGGKGFFLAKKKYIFSLLWKDGKNIANQGKHKAVGIELIQGSSSRFVKDMMKKLLNRLLMPNTSIDTIMKIGAQIVSNARDVDKKSLCKITGITDYDKFIVDDKDRLEFKEGVTIPIHVRAAANYNHFMHKNDLFKDGFEKISSGSKIYWYYTVNGGAFGLHEDINYCQFKGMPEMNIDLQIEKLILSPMKRFLFNKEIKSEHLGKTTVQKAFIPRKKI